MKTTPEQRASVLILATGLPEGWPSVTIDLVDDIEELIAERVKLRALLSDSFDELVRRGGDASLIALLRDLETE